MRGEDFASRVGAGIVGAGIVGGDRVGGDDLRGRKTICKVPNHSLHCSSVQKCSNGSTKTSVVYMQQDN